MMQNMQTKKPRMRARRGTSRAPVSAGSPGNAATLFMVGTALAGCIFILLSVIHLTPNGDLDEPLPRAIPNGHLDEPLPRAIPNNDAKSEGGNIASPTTRREKAPIRYHHIFSTGCSKFQDWQSYLFFFSAMKIGQPGEVTRIAACKTETEANELRDYHKQYIQPMSPDFHLHITPDFSGVKKGHNFKYFNKPFSTHHFMENVLGYNLQHQNVGDNPNDETILILYDPDQIILRPFTNNTFRDETEQWMHRTTHPIEHSVTHGKPMGQLYGFATQWRTKTNITRYVPSKELPSFVQTMSPEEAHENYSVGPPYIATAHDFYKIATRWKHFVPLVHDDYPYLLAEMFAYCLAAAHLKLPHQVAKSFMVSEPTAITFEGWSFLDGYSKLDVCTPGAIRQEHFPHVLHYCQRYILGKFVIGKHRVPHSFLSCEGPLFREPPSDVGEKYNFGIEPDKKEDVKTNIPVRSIKGHAFMLCNLLSALNKAAIYYKNHHCEGKHVNKEMSLVYHDSMDIDPKFFQ